MCGRLSVVSDAPAPLRPLRHHSYRASKPPSINRLMSIEIEHSNSAVQPIPRCRRGVGWCRPHSPLLLHPGASRSVSLSFLPLLPVTTPGRSTDSSTADLSTRTCTHADGPNPVISRGRPHDATPSPRMASSFCSARRPPSPRHRPAPPTTPFPGALVVTQPPWRTPPTSGGWLRSNLRNGGRSWRHSWGVSGRGDGRRRRQRWRQRRRRRWEAWLGQLF